MIKPFLETVQSIATIIALVVGAVWGLYIYDKQREAKPQLNIDHSVQSVRLNGDYRLVHVAVSHENRGKTLIRLNAADIRVQQVMPMASTLVEKIGKGEDLVRAGESVVQWPLLCHRTGSFELELEPNETHESVHEFVIPSRAEIIKIYTYYPNSDKDQIGWSNTTIFDLTAEEDADEAHPREGARAPRICGNHPEPASG